MLVLGPTTEAERKKVDVPDVPKEESRVEVLSEATGLDPAV